MIGSFQSVRNELHPDGVARHGITVVRRISGGGAMFMEAGNCITYSLYLPQTLVDGISFADSYAFLDAWVMAALEKARHQRLLRARSTTSPRTRARSAARPRSAWPTAGCCITSP